MGPPRKGSTARGEEARALERARHLPNARTAVDVEALKRAFLDHLQFAQGKDEHTATALDRYFAVAYAVRDRMMRTGSRRSRPTTATTRSGSTTSPSSSSWGGRSRTTC